MSDFDDVEICPGCGAGPGDGLTEGCEHEQGCGFWRRLEEEFAEQPAIPDALYEELADAYRNGEKHEQLTCRALAHGYDVQEASRVASRVIDDLWDRALPSITSLA